MVPVLAFRVSIAQKPLGAVWRRMELEARDSGWRYSDHFQHADLRSDVLSAEPGGANSAESVFRQAGIMKYTIVDHDYLNKRISTVRRDGNESVWSCRFCLHSDPILGDFYLRETIFITLNDDQSTKSAVIRFPE